MALGLHTVFAPLLLALSAVAHPFHGHKWRDGVQVWQSSSKGRDVMWGRCGGWFRQLRSCILKETTCAAHLSQGPEDADIEVRLGNLPVFRNHPTYVQWWAARKSRQTYNALENPEEAEVYPNMFEAYPRYFDPDFNGGNVQVDGHGQAVIRFRAPAAHRIHKHGRVPHVHLRICSGGGTYSVILGRKDKIQLTPQGPVAKSECNDPESKLVVLGYRRLGEEASVPALPPLVAHGLERLGKIVEEVDLDTLEFSPVFQCLTANLFYDHTAGDCAVACPPGTAVSQGQCVKPAAAVNSFTVMWKLQLCGCDESCWADKRNSTLHRLRLGIADHLDIPLHEVQELDLVFEARSAHPHGPSLARLHVKITSPRYTMDTGAAMLRSLFRNMEESSEVLAMLVLGVRELFAQDLGFLHKRVEPTGEDIFAPFYRDLEIVKATETERIVEEPHLIVLGEPKHQPAPRAKLLRAMRLLGPLSAVAFAAGAAVLVMKSCNKKAGMPGMDQPLAPEEEDPPLFTGSRAAAVRAVAAAPPAPLAVYLRRVYARALQ